MTEARGLELARKLYEEYGRAVLHEELPDLEPHVAVGLVGEGSDSFGFDDDISRDHDWGPAFCLWVPEALLAENRGRIERALSRLPGTLDGYRCRMAPEDRAGRVGPLSLEGFYARFLRVPHAPKELREWLPIRESNLATATNGEVFADPSGAFTAIREELLAFYPEDLRLKKIAARCVAASQAGQYNLPRMMSRYAHTAVNVCRGRFTEAVTSLVFLLHKRYTPFYKWADRAMVGLSPLAAGIAGSLEQLNCLAPLESPVNDFMAVIEDICQRLADEMLAQGLVDTNDPWLWEQGPVVQSRIAHEGLRSLPVQFDGVSMG